MIRKKNISFLCLTLTLFPLFLTAQRREPYRFIINSGWQFHEAGDNNWHMATVPGCVHTDLMQNGIIDDVYYRDNEKNIQSIETKDWEYKVSFFAERNLLEAENVDLIFEGLDTYADVYLNDNKILQAQNMFVGYTVAAKDFIVQGQNILRIYFHSPVTTVMPQYNASPVKYPADNDASQTKVSMFTRKAAYQFGWDFAPRMVGCGIWRPVRIEAWNNVKITDVYIRPVKITRQRASYEAELNLDVPCTGQLRIIVRDYADGEFKARKLLVSADTREMKLKIPVSIKNPEFWYPNTSGRQPLYNIEFEVIAENNVYKISRQIGVRTVEVINKPDKSGKSFQLNINGVPTYMRGANYVPMDLFPSRVSLEQYQKLFADIKKCNFNMLRVWGGGIYENDDFYRLADENGILIWQDFMFSGSMYPSDITYIQNVKAEAEYNIKRLRNHPSLALWCGNNEIQVAWENWGWQKTYYISSSEASKMYDGYKKLFHQLLPSVVSTLDSGRFYFPSSPQSNWGKAEEFKSGDNHYWGVWHGEDPVESFQNHIPRFASEFGLPSLPQINSVTRFTVSTDLDINSDVIKNRMKSYKGLGLLQKYAEDNYHPSTSFFDFDYITNVLQADAVTSAIESQRRSKPFCMGSLYWQLDDCYPGISWSSIDYYGKWKALQYRVSEAYQNIIITPQVENNKVKLWIVNDKNEDFIASLDLHLINFSGGKLWHGDYKLKVKAGECVPVEIDSLMEKINKNGKNAVVLQCILYDKKGLITHRNIFFDKTKSLQLPAAEIEHEVCLYGKSYLVTLQAKTIAKNVYLSVRNDPADFADNYFDMMPGEVRQVEIKSSLPVEQLVENLKITSMKDE